MTEAKIPTDNQMRAYEIASLAGDCNTARQILTETKRIIYSKAKMRTFIADAIKDKLFRMENGIYVLILPPMSPWVYIAMGIM